MPTYSQSLTGVTHKTSYGLIVRHGAAGAIALATDATAQQPFGVVQGGDHYDDTFCNVVAMGPAHGLVGAAGLAAGFHFLTCDAASKVKAAADGDAVVGYAFVKSALEEDQIVEFIVAPNPGEAAA